MGNRWLKTAWDLDFSLVLNHAVQQKSREILQICFAGPPLCLNIDAMEGDGQPLALWHSVLKVTDVKRETRRIHYIT